jgi:hypothetical protein
MTKRTSRTIEGLFGVFAGVSLAGCELIAAVDHDLIPEGTGGATATSSSTSSSGGGGVGGAGGAGGASTTSTTTATGGAGGAGGGCTTASECPQPSEPCLAAACDAGVCGTTPIADGTLTEDQIDGDCKRVECDGAGAEVVVNDDADKPVDTNECTDNLCDSGTPSNTSTLAGTTCSQNGGAVCDGLGACVECVNGGNCASGVCTSNVCQAATCMDSVKNGDETDVDCGGPLCSDCPTGKACMAAGDCLTGVCTSNVCQAATCMDSVKNGDETDVDCGGPLCSDCVAGKMCAMNTDCTSDNCVGNVCM